MFSYKRTFMNLRTSTLALLALTMIPSGMALTSSESVSHQQELDAIYHKLNLKKAPSAPKKPLTTWEKIKQKLAWFNVNRVLGITGVVLIGWVLKQQFFSENAQGGNGGNGGKGPRRVSWARNYTGRLHDAEGADLPNIEIQGPIVLQPNGAPLIGPDGQPVRKRIIISQVRVVPQAGASSCGAHTHANLMLAAQAEAQANEVDRKAGWEKVRKAAEVGPLVEQVGIHGENVMAGMEGLAGRENLDKSVHDAMEMGEASTPEEQKNREASRKELRNIIHPDDEQADITLVKSMMGKTQNNCPAGSYGVAHFDNRGQPREFLPESFHPDGIHRLGVRSGAHYLGAVINRQGNTVHYKVMNSIGGDSRQNPNVLRAVAAIEFDTYDARGANGVDILMNRAKNPGMAARIDINDPAAMRFAHDYRLSDAQRKILFGNPGQPAPHRNEFHAKELGAQNPPPPAPKPAAKPAEPKPGDGGAAAATASATAA